MELEGVLNPAAARGPDGELYLFPRLVGRNNYSRIGIARVRFDDQGDPCAAERVGIALEPAADYERRPGGGGGCEDPRVTYVEPLQNYVMTYTAFSTTGPRIALAVSEDLLRWRRVGLVTFLPYGGLDFDGIDDKDASVFPVAIPTRASVPSWPSCTARCSPGRFPRTPHATAHRDPSISAGKASGSRTVRCNSTATNEARSAGSPRTTASQPPCRPGSGSRSAEAPLRCSPDTAG